MDAKSGEIIYRSKHFPIHVNKIEEKLTNDNTVLIDTQSLTIRFKRYRSDDLQESQPASGTPAEHDPESDTYGDLITEVLTLLKSINRDEDLIAVLYAIKNNQLSITNIVLQLFLDIGQFLRQSTVHSMRYSPTSLQFWVTISKLFHGKAIRFFRGYKGTGLSKHTKSGNL